jgi:hypothetical protein
VRAGGGEVPVLCAEGVPDGVEGDDLFEELEAGFARGGVREVGEGCAAAGEGRVLVESWESLGVLGRC